MNGKTFPIGTTYNAIQMALIDDINLFCHSSIGLGCLRAFVLTLFIMLASLMLSEIKPGTNWGHNGIRTYIKKNQFFTYVVMFNCS